MQNKVELLSNDIIYVEKIGNQTEQTLFELVGKINQLTTGLRIQNKRVLILSNSQREGNMDPGAIGMAVKIGKDMDYDKSAAYGSPAFLHTLRENLIIESKLSQKVANFKTREEAVDWLLK